MRFHDLCLLIAKREGKKKSIDICQIREVLSILRNYLGNKRNKRVAEIIELLLTPKK